MKLQQFKVDGIVFIPPCGVRIEARWARYLNIELYCLTIPTLFMNYQGLSVSQLSVDCEKHDADRYCARNILILPGPVDDHETFYDCIKFQHIRVSAGRKSCTYSPPSPFKNACASSTS